VSKPFVAFPDITPRAPVQIAPEVEHAQDAVGERLGFVSREPVQTMPLKRRKPVEEPTFSFTARVSLRSGNRFIAYCEEERISYREGFDRLMAALDRERGR
jgi:hypothetical protein